MSDGTNNGLAIEAVEVGKTYKGLFSRKVHALDALSVQIQPGEIFGLLGPNGAGKTTLIKILLDICRPTTGVTRVFGVDSRSFKARRRVGYLPEDHQFPPYLTGLAALELYGALSGLSRAEARERGAAVLARVGLADWGTMKTRKYSKGMKQRLGIAQAIFHDPDLIFLDEPTDGVDPVGRKEIRSLLLELQGAGKTVFINSHLLLEVEMICHRVVILHRGRVLSTGSVEELTRAGNEYRLRAGGDAAKALAVVREKAGDAQVKPDGIRFRVADEATLDAVTAALAAAGHPIRELTPLKASLEDIFIGLVEGSDNAAEEGAPPA